jgi:beta-mannosidase
VSIQGDVWTSGEEEVLAAPLANTHVHTLDFSDRVVDENQRELVFVCELWRGDQRIALTVAPFVRNKHLALIDPKLEVDVEQEGDRLVFIVSAASLARFVELALAGTDVVFSDNYFDLPAGRTITVTCPIPDGWTVEKAREALRVRSLYDSYA